MTKAICKIEGCGRPVKGLGYCGMHYQRFKAHGDPLKNKKEEFVKKKCSVEGCDNYAICHGLCSKHDQRYRKYGDPVKGGKFTQDGRLKHPLYSVWLGMKYRCYNQKSPQYNHYGAKGIKMCDRWLEPNGKGFWNFVEDMGERPVGMSKNNKISEYSIDRVNPNGDYCPENCRWADWRQQAINKTSTSHPYIYYRKDTKKYTVLIRKIGTNENIFRKEFFSIEEAISSRNAFLKEIGFPPVE